MMTITFAELADQLSTTTQFHTDFADDLDIPILSGPQCQGDVSICPIGLLKDIPATTNVVIPVAATGVEVIRGGAMNNSHTLRTLDPHVTWVQASSADDLPLGILTVPEGAQCFLEHPEHGFNGIAAGTYVIGRQREQADIIRMVAD